MLLLMIFKYTKIPFLHLFLVDIWESLWYLYANQTKDTEWLVIRWDEFCKFTACEVETV